jgi:hypothetical protein
MQPVSHISFSFQFLLSFVSLLIVVFVLGDIFYHVNPTFAPLDITIKESPNQPYSPVQYETDLKQASHLTSFAALPDCHHKAKALLPILAISRLLLNSSICSVEKHLLQTVFRVIYFFNCVKHMSLPVHTHSTWHNYFSPEAMSHLHGKHLMDLLSPSEEVFIRFVILVDLMHYHRHSLFTSLRKYKLLFSSEESKALSNFMDVYEGDKVESPSPFLVPPPTHKKIVKGFCSNDIALYMSIKKEVVNEHAICSKQTVVGKAAPFTFHFPEVDGKIKKEPDISSSDSKRKHQVISHVTACAMLMDSDPTGVYRV